MSFWRMCRISHPQHLTVSLLYYCERQFLLLSLKRLILCLNPDIFQQILSVLVLAQNHNFLQFYPPLCITAFNAHLISIKVFFVFFNCSTFILACPSSPIAINISLSSCTSIFEMFPKFC